MEGPQQGAAAEEEIQQGEAAEEEAGSYSSGASSSGSETAMSDHGEHGEERAEEQLLAEGAAAEEVAQGATSQATASTTKSKSKRGANKVTSESWVITKLNPENYPEEPEEAGEKFANTCNAIVRERARIYQRWGDVPEDVKQDCYEAAWKRFVPANDSIRERLERRMHHVMRKGQSTWQYNCRKLLGKDWKTVVNKHWRGISEQDWERFKVFSRSPEFKASQQWYKGLREKRHFDHRLGSRGRPGKEKVWAKEDAALEKAGIQPRVPTLLRGERSSKWMRSLVTANQWAGLEPMTEKHEAALVRPRPAIFFYPSGFLHSHIRLTPSMLFFVYRVQWQSGSRMAPTRLSTNSGMMPSATLCNVTSTGAICEVSVTGPFAGRWRKSKVPENAKGRPKKKRAQRS